MTSSQNSALSMKMQGDDEPQKNHPPHQILHLRRTRVLFLTLLCRSSSSSDSERRPTSNASKDDLGVCVEATSETSWTDLVLLLSS